MTKRYQVMPVKETIAFKYQMKIISYKSDNYSNHHYQSFKSIISKSNVFLRANRIKIQKYISTYNSKFHSSSFKVTLYAHYVFMKVAQYWNTTILIRGRGATWMKERNNFSNSRLFLSNLYFLWNINRTLDIHSLQIILI